MSLGIGGHISWSECSPLWLTEDELIRHAYREICEELKDPELVGPLRICGLINEDETEVGTVHLGVVLHGTCVTPVASNEKDKVVEVQPLTLQEIAAQISDFELWSRMIVVNATHFLS
jgi:predicted NUDIX family phosphoesterase